MQKTTLLLCSLLLLLTAGSCRKRKPQPDNLGTSGNYQPDSAGSTWSYQVRGTSNYDHTMRAENRDSIIDGVAYRVMSSNKDPYIYHWKDGGNYHRYSRQPEFNFQPVEFIYLRDYLAVGQEWEEVKSIKVKVAGIDINVTAFMKIKILEKGIDYTVNGVTFKNVIHVEMKPEFRALLTTIGSTSDIHYYYAENVGMIYNKSVLKIPTADVDINKDTKLVAYSIQ
jgi:hypothetical protein